MRAYGVFEGGGAKGYAHIGALKAAESRGIEFEAVAGTSAGAIVSAFIAAGFTSEELFHIDESGSRSGAFAIDAFELLDPGHWDQWRKLSESLKEPRKRKFGALLLSIGISALVLRVGIANRAMVNRFLKSFGNTSTDLLKKFVDDQLRAKLGLPSDCRARFRDLKIPLRVVASNIATGKMQILSNAEYPEMYVSDAVAASACYPIFFQPVQINGHPHVDGGIVSNHPAWAFDDLRERSARQISTIGFRFNEERSASPVSILGLGTYLSQLLKTALFGAAALEIREVRNYYLCGIVPGIDTLDFNQLHDLAPSIVERGRAGADEFIVRNIGLRDPDFMARVLSAIGSEFRRKLGVPSIRSYIVDKYSDSLYRVLYSYGMTLEIEQRTLIHKDVPGLVSAFIEREPVHIDVEKMPQTERERNGVIASAGGSVYVIPVFKSFSEWAKEPRQRGEPMAALVLASNEPFKKFLLSEEIEDYCASVSGFVAEHLSSSADKAYPKVAPEKHAGWEPVAGKNYITKSGRKQRRNMGRDAELVSLSALIGRATRSATPSV